MHDSSYMYMCIFSIGVHQSALQPAPLSNYLIADIYPRTVVGKAMAAAVT